MEALKRSLDRKRGGGRLPPLTMLILRMGPARGTPDGQTTKMLPRVPEENGYRHHMKALVAKTAGTRTTKTAAAKSTGTKTAATKSPPVKSAAAKSAATESAAAKPTAKSTTTRARKGA